MKKSLKILSITLLLSVPFIARAEGAEDAPVALVEEVGELMSIGEFNREHQRAAQKCFNVEFLNKYGITWDIFQARMKKHLKNMDERFMQAKTCEEQKAILALIDSFDYTTFLAPMTEAEKEEAAVLLLSKK